MIVMHNSNSNYGQIGRLTNFELVTVCGTENQSSQTSYTPHSRINDHVYLATIAVTFSVGLKSYYFNLGYNGFDFETRIFWLQYFHFGIPSMGSIFGLAEFKILGVIFIPYGVKTSNT